MPESFSWREQLDRWLAGHHGVVSTHQLSSWGCPTSTIGRMSERGELIRVFEGVFRARSHPRTEQQAFAAVCATGNEVAIGALCGCRLWELRRIPPSGPQALVPAWSSPTLPGVEVTRSRVLAPVDYVRREDGILVTNPIRSLFDASERLGVRAATSVLEQILDRGLCSLEMVRREVERLSHPRRRGTKTMRTVLGSRSDLERPMQSDLEVRVLAEVRRQRLPAPVTQYVLSLDPTTIARFDFAWPDLKLALEVDHRTWHGGSEAQSLDKRRDRLAAALGWQTLRITDEDVRRHLAEAIAEVAAAIRTRRAA